MSIFKPKGLLCPRCEQPLSEHKDGECRRGLSRRSFFGAIFGGAVAVAAAPKLITSSEDVLYQEIYEGGPTALWKVAGDKWMLLPMGVPVSDLWASLQSPPYKKMKRMVSSWSIPESK